MNDTARNKSWRVNVATYVPLAFLSLLPIFLVLSHRNIAGQIVMMGIGAAFYPGSISALTEAFRFRNLHQARPTSVFLWLFLFCVYTAISVLWTPVPERWGWSLQITLFLLLASAVLWLATSVNDGDRQRLCRTYVIGVFIACIVIGFEALTGGQIRDLIPPNGRSEKELVATARGAGLAIYVLIPVVIAFIGNTVFSKPVSQPVKFAALSVLLFPLGIAIVRLDVSANLFALVAALLAGAAGYIWPRTMIRIVLGGVIAAFLSTPFLTIMLPPTDQLADITALPASWIQRLIAWRISGEHIFSSIGNFLFGGGLNFSWMLAREGETVQLSGWPTPLSVMPSHPHSLPVQIWLEFGLVGAGLVITASVQVLRYIITRPNSPIFGAGVCSLIAVMFIFSVVEVNLWTLWRLAGFIFGILGFMLIFRRDPQSLHVR